MNKYLIFKIHRELQINTSACFVLKWCGKAVCLFYVAPLAPLQQSIHMALFGDEQISNTHFILELHHLTLPIKTMVIPPECMVNGEAKYTMVGLSESGFHTDE